MKIECNHRDQIIIIFPDYSSSGMWCNNCGCGIANPKEFYPEIPSQLIDLIELWNEFWDFASCYDVNKEHYQQLINRTGKTLAEKISKYHKCILGIERCKLDINHG